MLDAKVFDICAAYGYKRCPECPLYGACAVSNDDMPGETLAEKTEYWEKQMNEAAKAVPCEY